VISMRRVVIVVPVRGIGAIFMGRVVIVVPIRGIGVIVLGRVIPATTMNHYQG